MMKKRLLKTKTNWKTIVFSILGTLFLLILLPLPFGYKLCFAKQFDFDVDMTLNFITTFAALGAIAVAIYIPNKISENDNKIAVFHDKYEVCKLLSVIDGVVCQLNGLLLDGLRGESSEITVTGDDLDMLYRELLKNDIYTVNKKMSNLSELLYDSKISESVKIISREFSAILNCLQSFQFKDGKDNGKDYHERLKKAIKEKTKVLNPLIPNTIALMKKSINLTEVTHEN